MRASTKLTAAAALVLGIGLVPATGGDGSAVRVLDAPAAVRPAAPLPQFEGSAVPLPDEVRARMTGVSWRPGCPVALDDLAYLQMSFVDFDGVVQRGEMVVAADAADDVLKAFGDLFAAGFPIARMELVDAFGGDDDRSMAANNTSAFNCRPVAGGSSFSQHSYGAAIDLNPLQNPYVKGRVVLPPAAAAYRDRSAVRPGMIVAPGAVTDAFAAIGWTWGGTWTSLKDYQHFSRNGH